MDPDLSLASTREPAPALVGEGRLFTAGSRDAYWLITWDSPMVMFVLVVKSIGIVPV